MAGKDSWCKTFVRHDVYLFRLLVFAFVLVEAAISRTVEIG